MSDLEKKEMDLAAKDFAQEENKYKYIAFISYRHLEPDATIAKKIHTMIETFKLPREFYVDGKKPNFRVFRDREELTTTSLSTSIDDAIRNSKYLIVICSKRLPLSEWCNIEAETFIRLHGVDRVIPVLVEGEPEESFPKPLLGGNEEVVLEDETVEVKNMDILAAEFRPSEVLSPSFEGYEYLEKNNPSKLKEITNKAIKLMDVEKYRIMAAILGVSYGDLRQRDKLRKQRRLLTLSGIVGAALLFFGIFMYNAYKNENIAKRQTIQDKAAFMMDKSDELLNGGDMYKSMILANNAMKDVDQDMADYKILSDRHKQILNNSVNLINPVFYKTIVTNNQFTFIDMNEKGDKMVAGLNNDSIGLWDVETGNLIKTVSGHKQQVKLVDYSPDDKYVVSGGFDGKLNIWDANDLKLISSKQFEGNIMLLNFTKDGKYVDLIEDRNGKYFFQRHDSKTLKEVGKTIHLNNGIKRIVFDAKDENMWVCYNTNVVFQKNMSLIKYNLITGKLVKSYVEKTKKIEDYTGKPDKDGKLPLIDQTLPYLDINKSNDGKSIYMVNVDTLFKLDTETDKIVFESKEFSTSYKSDFLLVESFDGKSLYSPYVNSIVKLDTNTGKKLLEIRMDLENIRWLAKSKDTNSLAVLSRDGEVVYIKDDKIKEHVSKLDSGGAEYIYLSPNGKNIITLSLTETKIKLAKVDRDNNYDKINGQIVAVSDNQRYIVLLNNKKYEVWDVSQKKKLYEVKNENLPEYDFLFQDNKLIVSNDGRYISGVQSLINTETKIQFSEIFVIDATNSKTVYNNDKAKHKAKIGFSPDSKYVFFSVGSNKVIICSIKDKKPVYEIESRTNYFQNIKIADDNKHMYINYEEGVGEVYNIEDQSFKGSVVGSILNVGVEKKDIVVHAIYNNEATKYVNFKKSGESVLLTNKRSEHGVSLPEQIYFNPEKNLMFSIKTKDKMHYFYLIDFKTGQLVRSFEVYLSQYRPLGFITPDGNSIGFDFSFDNVTKGEDKTYENDIEMVMFPILSYSQLQDISDKELSNVKLTDREKEELKLE